MVICFALHNDASHLLWSSVKKVISFANNAMLRYNSFEIEWKKRTYTIYPTPKMDKRLKCGQNNNPNPQRFILIQNVIPCGSLSDPPSIRRSYLAQRWLKRSASQTTKAARDFEMVIPIWFARQKVQQQKKNSYVRYTNSHDESGFSAFTHSLCALTDGSS